VNPYDKAHELARAIEDSDAFKAMKVAKAKIGSDDQAKRMLGDFHMKQFQFEQKRLMGQEPTDEEQEGLRKLYEILQLHAALREYLMAEYQMGTLMQDVQKILADVLDDVTVEPTFDMPMA